jgi:hypothetical protein
MLDAEDRGKAGAEVVQKVGEDGNWANRGRSVAKSEDWPSRSGQACDNTDLKASADR